MLKRMEELIRGEGMLPRGSRVLCAVSGGADSVCMLHMLLDLSKSQNFSVCAAHFNHMLRGEEADRDEAFVTDMCLSLGIPFFSGSGDVAAFAKTHGQSTEEAARIMRYDFLHKTC